MYSNSAKDKLILADSLFAQKKYTQSFELYSEIQNSDHKASASMLLKMAFIKEGLGDYTQALYYLNLYYLQTYNQRALKKMENLADRHQLLGYNYDDVEFFLNLYHQYQIQIDLVVVSLVVLFFSIMLYQKRNNRMQSSFPGMVYVTLLLVLLLINNFARESSLAIVTASDVYLMKGPSSGADVVDVVSQGHRVEVLGKEDIWVKILWNGREAFIKSFDLKPVQLSSGF